MQNPTTPPSDGQFKQLATYLSNSTFTAPRAGWYKFYVIGKGGSGGPGGRGAGGFSSGLHGDDYIVASSGDSGGSGGRGGYGEHMVYLEKNQTVVITFFADRTQLTVLSVTVAAYNGANGTSGADGSANFQDHSSNAGYGGAGGSASGGNVRNIKGSDGLRGNPRNKVPEGVYGKTSASTSAPSAHGPGSAAAPSGTKYSQYGYGGAGGSGGSATVSYANGNYTSPTVQANSGGAGGIGGQGAVVVEDVPNSPPSNPTNIQTTGNSAGQDAVTRWGASVDAEGDHIVYTLEQRTDGGPWSQIYQGDGLQATHPVPNSGTYFQRRVKASDDHGNESAYVTEAEKLILYNKTPTISGENTDLGAVHSPVEYSYTVDDADPEDNLTVAERLDGVLVRNFSAQRNVAYAFDLRGWQDLSLGQHTLAVEVSDGKSTAARSITFTRVENSILCYQAQATLQRADKVILIISPSLPEGWNGHIWACNNAADETPAWEDVSVNLGEEYEFANTEKTAATWAFGVKIDITEEGDVPVTIRSVSASLFGDLADDA